MLHIRRGHFDGMKTLVVTASTLALALLAALGWFMLTPDPLGGEPYALLSLEGSSRPDARPKIVTSRSGGEAQTKQTPAEGGKKADTRAPGSVTLVANDAPIVLPDVPVRALVENSRYGPLPKIAEDGRKPSEVYARPTRVAALPEQGEPARIAILITGLGLSEQITTEAITKLPPEISLAFSPYGSNLQSWVRQARGAGHEVMLQLPLEPFDYPDNDPGPQTLLTSLSPEENKKRLLWLLARFTGYTGVTNHMGAKFVAAQEAFLPVLEELRSRGLIYVDDGTAARSAAGAIARDLGLGFTAAHLQIDVGGTPDAIDEALEKLETMSRETGLAIGVGTSLPVTIARLSAWARGLADKGIILVPVSAAVLARQAS
ncbi:MAG: divergent polysaccharide deacetylase family protein [Methyloligellaceae bacterium]